MCNGGWAVKMCGQVFIDSNFISTLASTSLLQLLLWLDNIVYICDVDIWRNNGRKDHLSLILFCEDLEFLSLQRHATKGVFALYYI